MYSDYERLIKMDLSQYAGKWVAVCDSKIVAANSSIKQLIKESEAKCGKKKPVITKVSSTARIL
ncbi:succinyl-CoA synthetase subunit alpha [Candidatus Woesearchaeota archaeon]|nr:succinyl-CoA synthetase subunit alpha [Candidatus Woesearchaeota archaeon]